MELGTKWSICDAIRCNKRPKETILRATTKIRVTYVEPGTDFPGQITHAHRVDITVVDRHGYCRLRWWRLVLDNREQP